MATRQPPIPLCTRKPVGGYVSRLRSGTPVSGQERCPQDIGDGLSQERTPFHRSAYGVCALPEHPAGQPANVRTKQGGAQEQRIKVQPYIPVMPGTQIEVPRRGRASSITSDSTTS
jgi:hypothetical protein